jgi:Domain of unknown function (DUF4149)
MRARRIWTTALTAVALLWAGMVLGVAFVAVPAQFAADGLTRPQGIDVTRQVFTRFDRVEFGLAAATLLLALLLRARPLLWSLLGLVWLIVALQSLWLLPVLDLRADQLLQGQEPAPGPWHGLFAGAEVVKLCALLAVAAVGRYGAGRGSSHHARRG